MWHLENALNLNVVEGRRQLSTISGTQIDLKHIGKLFCVRNFVRQEIQQRRLYLLESGIARSIAFGTRNS